MSNNHRNDDDVQDLVDAKVAAYDERRRLQPDDDDNDMMSGRRGNSKQSSSFPPATRPGAVAVPPQQERVTLGTFDATAPDSSVSTSSANRSRMEQSKQASVAYPDADVQVSGRGDDSLVKPGTVAAVSIPGEGDDALKKANKPPGGVGAPGAVSMRGMDDYSRPHSQQYDSQEIYSRRDPESGELSTPHIIATLVNEDSKKNLGEEMPVAVAKKDTFWRLLRHDRRTKIIAMVFLVALVGLGVGLGVALSQSGDDDKDDVGETYLQAGSNIDGPGAFFELGSGEQSKFGSSVSLSGDGMYLAVGAPEFEGLQGETDLGLVQFYSEKDGDWALMEPSGIVGTQAGDMMGTAVSMSLDGTTAALASPGFDGEKGRVLVFRRNAATDVWEAFGPPIMGQFAGQKLGTSVGISQNGNRVAVGTRGIPEAAKVFDYTDGAWVQTGEDLEGLFGVVNPVALSSDGTTVACGSLSKSANDFVGGIRVYQEVPNAFGEWTMRGTDILLRGAEGNYETGWTASLAGDGKTVAIGTSVENAQGLEEYDLEVRIFRFDADADDWVQQGLTQHDKTGTHLIAYTVFLSEDAQVLAIGDPGGFAMGINSGHTHVLRWQNNEWYHITRELEGTDAADLFGQSLGMSADGSRVCVGSPQSRATGIEVGRVQIFELTDE